MRILHTADWHLGKKLEGFSRIEEQKEVLQEICDIANDKKVEVVVIAGDIYDTYNPPTEAVELFYKTVKYLSKNATVPVIVIAGNHDSPDRIEAPDPLAIENGIFLLGYPNSIIKTTKLDSGLEIKKSNEGFAEFKLPNSDILLRVLFTPYANEHRIRVALNIEEEEKELKQILSKKWNDLAKMYCDANGVNILISHHFFVEPGKKAIEDSDDEKPILYVGGAQAIETTLIPKEIQYTALGHLHRGQNVGNESNPVMYSGSPLSYSFAEANQSKSVLVVDLNPSEKPQIEKIILESGKKLLKKKFDDIDKAVEWLEQNPNTLIELTIVADEFLSSIDRRRLYSAHSEIFIIPEIKGENLHSDKGDINLEQSREELFKLYFKHKKGLEPNEDIISIFRELIS